MTEMLQRHVAEAEAAFQKKSEALAQRRSGIVERQRRERADLEQRQQERWARDTAQRAQRLNKGFRGIWDRLTGTYGRIARQNEFDAWDAAQREREALIETHLDERQGFHQLARQTRETHTQDVAQLHRDIAALMAMDGPERPDVHGQFGTAARRQHDGSNRGRNRHGADDVRERDFEPER